MQQWFELKQGKRLFLGDSSNLQAAREVAGQCVCFAEDDEDEQIDDVTRSCYNCQYRRWLSEGFQCLGPISE
ncbi:hypothetical protein [Shewanella algae]|uniref:hypothetical protein n=1 Tax=Shewanella algae TaxID=38313 RepID=UPI0013204AB6|nr:hypothetical protein [Shewanella algae]QHD53040.1 hypothetical protein GM320_07605 [Shewanella algae]